MSNSIGSGSSANFVASSPVLQLTTSSQSVSNTAATSSLDRAASMREEQKLISQEEFTKLLATITKSKESLAQELKEQIKDQTICDQLTTLPQELQRSISLIQRDLKNISQQEFCDEIVTECDNINNSIDSHIEFIESKSTDRRDAAHAKTMLEVIKKNCAALKNKIHPETPKSTEPQTYLDYERLRLEQQLLCSHQVSKKLFTEALQQIAKVKASFSAVRSCYISYAKPDEKAQEKKLLQSFLEQLRSDLRLAGITAKLDSVDCRSGNINAWVKKEIETANYIIFVGTPAWPLEEQKGSSQLALIEKKRKTNDKCILPILLIGEEDTAFPSNFTGGNTTIADWKGKSYQANLKLLVQQIYNIGTGNTKYQELWQSFEAKCAFLARGLSPKTVTNLLAEEANRQQLTSEMDAKAAEACFREIGDIAKASDASTTAAIIPDASTHQPQVIARVNGGNAVAVGSINGSISNSPGAIYFGAIGSIGSLVIQQPTTSAQQLTTPPLNRESKTTVAEQKNSNAATYFHARCDSNSAHTKFFGPGRITREEAEKDLKSHNEEYKHTNGRVTPTSELDNGVGCEPTLA